MMTFSLVAMTGLEKCCITSAYLQWLCHSGERAVARVPLVIILSIYLIFFYIILDVYKWQGFTISFGRLLSLILTSLLKMHFAVT